MIVHAKNNFRGSIEPTLNVGVDCKTDQNPKESCQTISHTFLMFEAATAEIDHFDCAFSWMAEKDVLERSFSIGPLAEKNVTYFRLQVAMNNSMMPHERKGHQHLTCKPSNEGSRKSNETISLDQFVQIDTEQFHGYAKMISEVKVLSHLYDMMPLIRILYLFSINK